MPTTKLGAPCLAPETWVSTRLQSVILSEAKDLRFFVILSEAKDLRFFVILSGAKDLRFFVILSEEGPAFALSS